MIHLPASVRVYLCLSACDMRKSFDGLHGLVRDYLERDAFAGHLFVFASRRRDRVKILYWDRDGFAIWSKRLEEGTYAVPLADSADEHRREITAQELGALRSGIDKMSPKRVLQEGLPIGKRDQKGCRRCLRTFSSDISGLP